MNWLKYFPITVDRLHDVEIQLAWGRVHEQWGPHYSYYGESGVFKNLLCKMNKVRKMHKQDFPFNLGPTNPICFHNQASYYHLLLRKYRYRTFVTFLTRQSRTRKQQQQQQHLSWRIKRQSSIEVSSSTLKTFRHRWIV